MKSPTVGFWAKSHVFSGAKNQAIDITHEFWPRFRLWISSICAATPDMFLGEITHRWMKFTIVYYSLLQLLEWDVFWNGYFRNHGRSQDSNEDSNGTRMKFAFGFRQVRGKHHLGLSSRATWDHVLSLSACPHRVYQVTPSDSK